MLRQAPKSWHIFGFPIMETHLVSDFSIAEVFFLPVPLVPLGPPDIRPAVNSKKGFSPETRPAVKTNNFWTPETRPRQACIKFFGHPHTPATCVHQFFWGTPRHAQQQVCIKFSESPKKTLSSFSMVRVAERTTQFGHRPR